MSIKTIFAYSVLILLFCGSAHGSRTVEEIKKIRNDKEVEISSFKEKEQKRILETYQDKDFNASVSDAFFLTMTDFVNQEEKVCELNFVERWTAALSANGLYVDEKLNGDLLKLLRVNNDIDDILYDILSGASKDYFAFRNMDYDKKIRWYFLTESRSAVKHNDPAELFENFNIWPDDTSICTYSEYLYTKNNVWVSEEKKSKGERQYKTLLKKAFETGVIDKYSYHKLKHLREDSYINDYYIGLKDYLEVVFNAKNKLVPISAEHAPVDLENENRFPSARIGRFSSLTRRKLLYEKYNPTQIVMLAQVLQKASQRMGVDPDTNSGAMFLVQEFEVLLANGERANYVERTEIDPQSQYNIARRRMRKDILDLQMMDTFYKIKISYSDVIIAALETGYITHEDIQFVAQYDDLWNPELSKWEKISNLIFNIAGYGTFFVPPPWNVVVSIAMGVAEGVIDNKFFRDGKENDNPATFIE